MKVLPGKLPKSKTHCPQYTWVFWNAELDLTGNNHNIVASGTKVQDSEISRSNQIQDSFPNGATGYHTIDV